MSRLAEMSVEGQRSSFGGVFSVGELSVEELDKLRAILNEYKDQNHDLEADLQSLTSITCEVRAITNQAAILHGERIKRAQNLFKTYREGAFSAWLMNTYGNRQTPYNFLQYYEFYNSMPKELRPQIERMPRQAVYTLASREGDMSNKKRIVEKYEGETKEELIRQIREAFPLEVHDGRRQDLASVTLQGLRRLLRQIGRHKVSLSADQMEEYTELQSRLSSHIKQL